jgi:glutamate/tyrosine decarboxylase-like PLP-dependent enzyme
VPDPLDLRGEHEAALERAFADAKGYLATLDEGLVREQSADEVADAIGGPLPEEGGGALEALGELHEYLPAATRSAGPRFFHFVIGGSTPAAHAADWLATTLDQNAGLWPASPLAGQLERVAVDWLSSSTSEPTGAAC